MMSNTDPSFFKVLSCLDFDKILRLPPAFVKKYEQDPSGNKELRSDSGRKWKVKVQRMENGLFCFTKGWQNFAADTALQLGEFLFFTRVAESDFVVQIFTTNFCQRQIPPPAPSNEEENNRTDLVTGWPEFQTMNGLLFGKTYSFEFNPNQNVIHVKEVIEN